MVQLCQNHWKTIDGNGGLKKNINHSIALKNWPLLWSNGLVEHFVHHYSACFFLFHGKRGLYRSLLEQVIFVCSNHFVLICVYVCKSAFYLYDNDCLCSPWNIASATWEQEIPLTVEETLHHHSLRRKSILKLCSCLQTWTFMSFQKTNSVSTTSFMKLVSIDLQTYFGLGGVDGND